MVFNARRHLWVAFAAATLTTLTPLLLNAQPAIKVGQVPPAVTLSDSDGGLVKDNAPWVSSSIKGKVTMLVYVAPSERDTNQPLTEAVRAQNLDRSQFASVAIINMAASRAPNILITRALRRNQEQYPDTTYVRDISKHLVEQWGLADDSYVVLAFDKEGKLLHMQDGKFNEEEIAAFVQLLKTHLDKSAGED